MKIKVKLLKPFSNIVGESELELEFDGKTLDDLIKEIVTKYPKLKEEFYKDNNELTEYVCMFVNDKPAAALNGTDTELENGDEVLFFIPISGG